MCLRARLQGDKRTYPRSLCSKTAVTLQLRLGLIHGHFAAHPANKNPLALPVAAGRFLWTKRRRIEEPRKQAHSRCLPHGPQASCSTRGAGWLGHTPSVTVRKAPRHQAAKVRAIERTRAAHQARPLRLPARPRAPRFARRPRSDLAQARQGADAAGKACARVAARPLPLCWRMRAACCVAALATHPPAPQSQRRTRPRRNRRATAAAMRSYAKRHTTAAATVARRPHSGVTLLGGAKRPPPVVSGAIERAGNAARRASRGARCRPPRPPAAERPPAPDVPARTQRRAGTSAAEGGRSASLGGHAASRSAAAQWSRRGAPRGRVRAARRPPEAARRRAASLRGGAGLAAGARGHRLQASKARGAAPGPGRGRRPPDPPHAGRRPAPARGPAPWTPAEARVRARLGQVRLAAQAGGGPEKRKITPGRASATARRRQR